jgi:thiamine biosynthesis lipoprotein
MSEKRVTSAGRAPIQRVEQVMGMPVITEVCDVDLGPATLDHVYRWLRFVDSTFSTYKPDSEISRLNRGEIQLAETSFAVRSVVSRCEALRQETNGYFDIEASMPDGGVDPAGLVKGWAVLGGARLLEHAGARNYCIDAGGDIIARGQAPQGGPWRIGIAHPRRPDAVACTVTLTDQAIATSGTYERGPHIINPHSNAPPEGLLSVTVIGPDLATADAYATAAFAMGHHAGGWCTRQVDYDFMLITDDETVLSTAGFTRHHDHFQAVPDTRPALSASPRLWRGK